MYILAWQKLKKDLLAMSGLVIIVAAIIIGILAYVLSPDNTPNANDQHLELATQKPGFSVKMLKIRKNEIPKKTVFYNQLLFGKHSNYLYVPFASIEFKEDKIRVKEYSTDDQKTSFESEYRLLDVVYPLRADIPTSFHSGIYDTIDLEGKPISASRDQLVTQIQDNQIEETTFLLGTDRFGRDLLSRLIIGTRVSLAVGFIAVLISVIIGLTLGLLSGYFMGTVDKVIMWFINVVWSIPTLLMVIAITLAIGKGYWQVFVAVGITMWVEVARVTRGQVLSVREKEYVEAARVLGFSHMRIITKHILPNILNPIIIISAANFASAILIEAGLSFLGFGVQPPTPSWGSMIKDHYGFIIVEMGYLAVLPGMAIMIMVLSFTLLGNGLRDALDTRSIK